MTRRVTQRCGGRHGGFAALELVLGVGLLLVPIGAVVATMPRWSERQMTARSIAREVTRQATIDLFCAPNEAHALASEMASNLGVEPRDVVVAMDCPPGEALVPGEDLEVAVTITMPVLELPGLGAVSAWAWTTHCRVPVDPYASLP